jgi:release factor glutamine methyltransferase
MLVGNDQLLGASALQADVSLQPGETLDAVYRGELLLIQRRDGYRFSIDPLLLAAFAGRCRGRVIDLGTGCGIVPLLLALRGVREVVGVELQAPLFQLAYRNVQLNRCEDRVQLVNADLRQLRGVLPAGVFDLATSNPPYIPSKELPTLSPEVRREPCIALDGGEDGLAVLRRIVAGAPARLAPGGTLVVEMHETHAEVLPALCLAAGFARAETRLDLAGLPRLVVAALAGRRDPA